MIRSRSDYGKTPTETVLSMARTKYTNQRHDWTTSTFVYPQDGVGITLKNPEYHIPLYYSAIKRACDRNGRTFGATIETFHQMSGWPVDDSGSFSATSTDIATLKKQLWNAAQQQPDEMIQFAWSYMQPNLTVSSTNLYNDYRTYVEQDRCINDPDWRYRGQNKKSCAWLASRNWTDAKKLKWCNRRANNPKSDKTRVWAYCKELCYGLGKTQACP